MKISKPPFDYQTFLAQLRIFFPCQHPRPEPRRRIKAGNGQPFFRIQCPDCGQPLSGQLAYAVVDDIRRDFGPIAQWDSVMEKECRDRRSLVGKILRDDQNIRRTAYWWKEYETYLKSPKWKIRREQILTKCEGICSVCGDAPATQVHHLTYDRVGEELESDLVGLCKPCHDKIHDKETNRFLANVLPHAGGL